MKKFLIIVLIVIFVVFTETSCASSKPKQSSLSPTVEKIETENIETENIETWENNVERWDP